MSESLRNFLQKETLLSRADCWPIFESYFETVGFVRHHISSFNTFFSKRIQNVINEQPDVEIVLENDETPDFVPTTYVIQYKQLHIKKPYVKEADRTETKLLPMQARLRSLTYAASLYLDIVLLKITNKGKKNERVERKDAPKLYIGNIPIMVRSEQCHLNGMSKEECIRAGECEYDQGGYFIINGLEKVFIAQEKLPDNHVYVYKKKEIQPYSYTAQIRSIGAASGRSSASALLVGVLRTDEKLYVQLPQIRQRIPLYFMFCALGVTERSDIQQLMLSGSNPQDKQMLQALRPTMMTAHLVRKQDIALDYIGQRAAIAASTREKRITAAKQILGRELLPHLGGTEASLEKACALGRMAWRVLLCKLNRVPVDDRDSFGAKRVELAGPLLESLFKQIFRQVTLEISKNVQASVAKRKPVLFAQAIKSQLITNKMRYSFASGNWGLQRPGAAGVRTGVTQPLERQSYAATLSHGNRLDQQLPRDGKVTDPRLLHATQFAVCCPCETPEGGACGLVKNFSIAASVTVLSNNQEAIFDLLMQQLNVEPLKQFDANGNPILTLGGTKVLLGSQWIGTTLEPEKLTSALRECRRNGIALEKSTSVSHVPEINEIHIETDAGRLIRPLYVVKNGNVLLTKTRLEQMIAKSRSTLWEDLVKEGYIEFIDVQESRNTQIAMYVDHVARLGKQVNFTHCEIHPAAMLGVSASLIPFPDHNPAPRNTYNSAMCKQGMSVPNTNFRKRMDTASDCLHYPQQPLVQTRFSRYLKFNNMPSGVVCIVAFLCRPEENEEDAIVMNKGAIDRGLFRSTSYRTYQDRERLDTKPSKKRKRQEKLTETTPVKREKFERPNVDTCAGARFKNFDCLDSDGLAIPGTLVKGRDVIVGKVTPMPEIANGPTHIDCSKSIRSNERNCYIDSVMLTDATDGTRLTKVKTRSERRPEVGDKFSSMHGQKGTIGNILQQADMPFSPTTGMSPDILINAHAMPTRMTVGMMIEMLTGKAAAMVGSISDGTPFCDLSMEQIEKVLKDCGMEKNGNEQMCSGTTGEMMETTVFMGPTFYQRLKHMAADKAHARAYGPNSRVTHQPVEGRGRDGGLRFGEMERDCVVAYGTSELTLDRLKHCSDNFITPICRECGLFAIENVESGEMFCQRCNTGEKVERVEMPYAHKLMANELISAAIVPRAILKR